VKLCKIYSLADARDDDPLWHELLDAMTPEWKTLHALHRKYWEWGLGLYGLHKLGFIRPDAVGLGVGAGVEWPLFYLANRVQRVEAIDLYSAESAYRNLDPTIAENARKLAPFPYREEALVFRKMDALDLQYEDETFDFVFSFSSIEHFGGRGGAKLSMEEIARVLKPNGVAAIATEVMLNGRWHSEFFQPAELEPCLVTSSGLELVEPLDLTIDEELITNPVLFDVPPGFTGDTGPHTSVSAAGLIFTSVELFVRKPPGWKPMTAAARAAAEAERRAWYGIVVQRWSRIPPIIRRPARKLYHLARAAWRTIRR
jgi:SAM-dependent methyltransferase